MRRGGRNFFLGGCQIFVRGLGLSVAPEHECDITPLSSRIAFYNVLTSSSLSTSTTIALVSLPGL